MAFTASRAAVIAALIVCAFSPRFASASPVGAHGDAGAEDAAGGVADGELRTIMRRQLLGAPPTSQVLAIPMDCNGWPTKRVYLEGSAWYTRPGEDIKYQSARLHVGACMPHRQQLWGDIELHILVQKYNFPDLASMPTAPIDVAVNFSTLLGPKMRSRYKVKSKGLYKAQWDCAGLLCKAALPITVKTYTGSALTASIPDGLTKMTVIARYASLDDGKRKRALEARVDTYFVINNRGQAKWPVDQTLGVEQMAISDFPWGQTHADFTSDLPLAHVSSTWRFDTKHFIYWRARRSSNVTNVFVSIDPAWASPASPNYAGKISIIDASPDDIKDRCELYKGNLVTCALRGLELDTTLLERGLHQVFLRTDSLVAPGHKLMSNAKQNAGTFSAGTLVTFSVCNEDAATCAEPDPPVLPPRPEVPDLPPISPPNGTTWYKPADALPDPAAVISDPYNCAGWSGKRVYLEAQSWFTRPKLEPSGDSTQLHVGACLPHKQKVAGVVPLDIVVGKYNFPSNVNVNVNMRVSFIWQGGNTTLNIEEMDVLKGWGCTDANPVCKRVYRSLLDTRPDSKIWYLPDGLTRVLVWARLRFDDGVSSRFMEARVDSWMFIQNNVEVDVGTKPLGPASATRTHLPWKDTFTALTSDLPLSEVAGALPFATRHWLTGKIGVNVTGAFVAIDPFFTEPTPRPGHVLLDVPSASDGSMIWSPPGNCTMRNATDGGALNCTLTFDPAAVPFSCSTATLYNPCKSGLCDGTHRLVIRSDYLVPADNPMFLGLPPDGQVNAGTLSTVVVVPLVTKNGNSPSLFQCASGALPASAAAAGAAAPIDMVGTRVTLSAEPLPADAQLAAEMAEVFGQA